MRLKGKAFLFGLIAAVTSVTGVFAAWVFTEGVEEIDAGNQDISVDVSPSRRWEFDTVSVTVDASTYSGYEGKFGNEESTFTFSTTKNSCVDYDIFSSLVGGNPKLYDSNGNVVNNYVFAYWDYSCDEDYIYGDYFSFDKALTTDITLTAHYLPVDRFPVIYMASDTDFSNPIQALQVNKEGGEPAEYMTFDFVVDETKGTDHYVIRYDEYVYNTLSKVSNSYGQDLIVPGMYTVYFCEEQLGGDEWLAFGGNCWFARQYRWSLFGNPNNGWELTSNSPMFGLVSSEPDYDGVYDSIKTYTAKKVTFNDNISYEFKPYEPYFDIYPHIYRDDTTDYPIMSYDEGETSNYIKYPDSGNTENDNLIFINKTSERTFDITLTIKYAYPGSDDVYAKNEKYCYSIFPVSVEISMIPSTRTVTFFKEDGETIYATKEVKDGAKLELDKSFGLREIDEQTREYVQAWYDADTHEEVDFSTLIITSNQFVYPYYDTEFADRTLHFNTEYDYATDSYSGDITGYLFEGEYITEEFIANKEVTVPTSISDGINSYPVEHEGWRIIDLSDDSIIEVSKEELYTVEIYSGEYNIEPILSVYGFSTSSTSTKPTFIQNIEMVDYTVNSSSVYVGKYQLASNTFDGEEMNLITGSGIYRIWNDGSWRITRKIGLRLSNLDVWIDANARFVLYAFESTLSDNPYSLYRDTSINSNDYYFYYTYIDYSYVSIEFWRMNPGNESNSDTYRWNKSGSMKLESLDYSSTNIYITKPNSWYNDWTSNGCVTINDTVDSNILYLKPNSNWIKDGARFVAYFFGNGETWVNMTDYNGDGYYEVEKPSGYSSVIFVRMNGSASDNNWNNKWNQTSDLSIQTNGNNLYTVENNTWDNGNGTWSLFIRP